MADGDIKLPPGATLIRPPKIAAPAQKPLRLPPGAQLIRAPGGISADIPTLDQPTLDSANAAADEQPIAATPAPPAPAFGRFKNPGAPPAPAPQPDEATLGEQAFQRNKPFINPEIAPTNVYQTELKAPDEQAFRQWVQQNKIPFNPDDPHQDYDMRGFWQAAQDPVQWQELRRSGVIPPDIAPGGTKLDPNDGRQHFPDYWKTPYHQTFSNESKFATPQAPAWQGDKLVDNVGNVIFDDQQKGGAPSPEALKRRGGAGMGETASSDGSSAFLAEVQANLKQGNITQDAAQQIFDAYNQAHQEGRQIDPKSVAGRAALDALNEITNGGDLQATIERYVIGGGPSVSLLNGMKDRIATIQNILDKRTGVATVPTERQATPKEGFAVQQTLDGMTTPELIGLQNDLRAKMRGVQAAAQEKRGNMLLNLARIAGKWEGMASPQGVAAKAAAVVGHIAGQAPSPENLVGATAAPARQAFVRLADETIAQFAKRIGVDVTKAAAIDAANNAAVQGAADPFEQAAAINEGRQPAYDPLQSIANVGGAAAFGAGFGIFGRAMGYSKDAWQGWRQQSADAILNEFLRRNAQEGAAAADAAAAGRPKPPPPGSGTGAESGGPGTGPSNGPSAGAAGAAPPPPKTDYTSKEWAGKFSSTAAPQEPDGNFKVDENGFVMSDAGGPIMFQAPKAVGKDAQKQANRQAHRAAAAWINGVGHKLSPDQAFIIENHPAAKGDVETLTVREAMRRPKEEPAAAGATQEGAASGSGPSNEGENLNTGATAENPAAGEAPAGGPLGAGAAEEAKTEPGAPPPGTKENPAKPETAAEMDAATAHAANSPLNDKPGSTDAQNEAGNYTKSHQQLEVGGEKFDVAIETPKGGVRKSKAGAETPWEVTMPVHYGYIKRTIGADNEQVDVFAGDPKSDNAWVIDQLNPDGSFDEHKIVMGFPNTMAAIKAYTGSYSDNAMHRIGAITQMTGAELKAWLKSGAVKKPVGNIGPASDRLKGKSGELPPEEPAAPAAESSTTAETAGAAGEHGLESIPASQVGVDAKRFQFKSGGDEKGRLSTLKGINQWEPEKADIVTLYRDKDGKLWVTDGHQRVGLAQELEANGHPPINLLARVYNAADGWTPADVMKIAAIKNIAQGSGTPLDAAKVFRATGQSEKVLENLPPRSALVRDGKDLAKLGDEAFGMVVNDIVPANQGAIVGREIAGDKQQKAAMDILAKARPETIQEAQAIIDQIKAMGFEDKIQQGGLFGDEQVSESLVLERAKVLAHSMTELRRNRQLFNALIARGDIAKAAGNRLDTAANEKEKAIYEQILAAITKLANVKGPVSDALTAAARQYKGGKRIGAVAGDFLASVALRQGAQRGAGGAGLAAPVAREEARAASVIAKDRAELEARRALPEGQRSAAGGRQSASILPADRGSEPGSSRGNAGRDQAAAGNREGQRGLGSEDARVAAPRDKNTIDMFGGGPAPKPEAKPKPAPAPHLPGFEPTTEELVKAKGAAKKPEQKAADEGLFGQAHKQTDIEAGKGAEVTPPWKADTAKLDGPAGFWVGGADDFQHLLDSMGVKAGNKRGMAEAARRWVTERGSAKGVENIVMIDGDGNFIDAGTTNEPASVGFSDMMAAAMDGTDRQLIMHHNHPNNGSLSAGDINTLLTRGVRRVVAYGVDDDSIYSAERGPSFERLFKGEGSAVTGMNVMQSIVRQATGKLTEKLHPELMSVSREFNLVFWHAQTLVLEKMGLVHYVYSGAAVERIHPLATEVADEVVKLIPRDKLEAAFGAAQADWALSNRSARPRGQQEAMDRISGPAEDHAPGRSGGQVSAAPRKPDFVGADGGGSRRTFVDGKFSEQSQAVQNAVRRLTRGTEAQALVDGDAHIADVLDELARTEYDDNVPAMMRDLRAEIGGKLEAPEAPIDQKYGPTPYSEDGRPYLRVVDTHTGQEVGRYLNKTRARNEVDKKDNAYGGYRYQIPMQDRLARLQPKETPKADGPAIAANEIGKAEAPRDYFTGGPQPPPRQARAIQQNAVDIMGAISKPGLRGALQKASHTFTRMVADDLIRGKEAQAIIEKATGVPTPDPENFYLHAEMAPGRKAEQLERGNRRYVDPIALYVRRAKADLHTLEKGLYALHAEERNRTIARINAQMPDGGSGITTQMARDYLNSLTPAERTELHGLRDLVRRLRVEDLSNRVNYGLMDPAEAQRLLNEWPDYVPLQGGEDIEGDEQMQVGGQGFSVRGEEFKRAMGRWNQPRQILAHMIAQYHTGIARGENNRVGNSLALLANNHPDDDFWKVDKVQYRRIVDKNTGLVRLHYSADADPDHTVYFKIGGEPHRIWIADAKFVDAIKKHRTQDIMRALRWISTPLSWWRMATIPFNPEFMFGNAPRDMQEGLLNAGSYRVKGLRRGIIKTYFQSVSSALLGSHGHDLGPWTEWMRRASAAGAISGNFQPTDLAHYTKHLKVETGKGAAWATYRGSKAAVKLPFQAIESLNTAIEAGFRVAVFRSGVEHGLTELQAAHIAKNSTVNFDRHGSLGPYITPLYAFLQASINGTVTTIRAIKRRKGYMAAVGGALFAYGMAEALVWEWLKQNGDEEQKTAAESYDMAPAYLAERSMFVPWPTAIRPKDSPFATMPLGWALTMPVNFGRQTMRAMLGKISFAEMASAMFQHAIHYSSPIDPGEGWSGALPTLARPAAEVQRNLSWMGRPIYPDKHGKSIPDSQNYFSNVKPVWKNVAQALNRWTGGDEVQPGYIDWSPNSMEYLWNQYTSGAGAFVNRVLGVHAKTEAGQENDWSEIPVARRFIGRTVSAEFRDQFYTVYDKGQELQDQHDAYKKALRKADPGEETAAAQAKLDAFEAQHQADLNFWRDLERAKTRIDANRKKAKRAVADESLSDSEKEAQKRAFNDENLAIARDVIQRYNDEVAAPQQSDRAWIRVTPGGITLNH